VDREDIIRMAREAGFETAQIDIVRRFAAVLGDSAALVAAQEREECAKVCDDWPNGRDDVYSIGVAIRARKEK
jgi:hypothetical protein